MFLTELFINVCILVALLFVYTQLKWRFRSHILRFDKWLDGFAGGFLAIILMYFSIPLSSTTIVDFRSIPLLLVYLFSGRLAALITLIFIIIGRFLFGLNTSAYVSSILMISIYIGFLFIVKEKVHKDLKQLWWTSFKMALFINIATALALSFVSPYHQLMIFIPMLWFMGFIGSFIAVYVLWHLRKSNLLLKKYETESTTDFLTGLNNVRQFDQVWNSHVNKVNEKQESLSLLVIDIDHFKVINDTYGHPAGDQVLKHLGDVLQRSVRTFDTVSRNGGEEFSIILPDCPQDRAIEIAERIRITIMQEKFYIDPIKFIHITVSIGVASFPDHIKEVEQLLDKADQCLYQAKRLGRNRVCFNC